MLFDLSTLKAIGTALFLMLLFFGMAFAFIKFLSTMNAEHQNWTLKRALFISVFAFIFVLVFGAKTLLDVTQEANTLRTQVAQLQKQVEEFENHPAVKTYREQNAAIEAVKELRRSEKKNGKQGQRSLQ